MAAEIEHRAAPCELALQKPGPWMVGRQIEPLERVDLRVHRIADLARVDESLHALDKRVEVTIVRDPEKHVVRPAGRNHAVAFRNVEAHRLFAEDVLPRFCGRDRLLGVKVDGRGDIHGVHGRIDDHVAPIRVERRGAKLGGKRLGLRRVRPRDRHELAFRRVTQRRRHTLADDVTGTDESEFDGGHDFRFGVRGSWFGVRFGVRGSRSGSGFGVHGSGSGSELRFGAGSKRRTPNHEPNTELRTPEPNPEPLNHEPRTYTGTPYGIIHWNTYACNMTITPMMAASATLCQKTNRRISPPDPPARSRRSRRRCSARRSSCPSRRRCCWR